MIVPNADQPALSSEKAPSLPPKDPAGPQPTAEPLPPPPPYSPSTAGPSSAPQAQRSTSSVLQPQTAQTVNHFEIFSKHNAISGTYLIDPLLSTPAVSSNNLRKLRKKRNKAWGKGTGPAEINASFGTRHGAINLDLAVVEDSGRPLSPDLQKVPACVLVSTRHGRINVNLFEVQPGRSIDLQVESRHGRIVLFLPPTFAGPLMFQTRNANAVNFLPAFAARARTLRATDRETLVVCTAPGADQEQPKPAPAQFDQEGGDRVLVRTRHGRITVGISGLDKVEESAGGNLFQKLGELIESGGKAFGQYVEAHAAVLEKKLTERSAMMYGSPLGPKCPDRAAVART
ncbi:hypothetical protein OH77DRAFT_1429903 [Trametes cingulata]|nr:hypothetical protein OH77DRAFT_1429903 [Trametes cingulata]